MPTTRSNISAKNRAWPPTPSATNATCCGIRPSSARPSGNPREFLEAEKEDQEMAEACKRLIKNCIICWNYLYLSQKLEEITDTESREALLDAVAHGSTVAWRHLNLLGEYDFSAEKLRDSVGIRLQKWGLKRKFFWTESKLTNLNVQKGLG